LEGVTVKKEKINSTGFFPGTYAKSVIRECTIPIGVLVLESQFAEFHGLKTLEKLRICTTAFQRLSYGAAC
jgi:hypothetical protein